jgi:hypothetical protein
MPGVKCIFNLRRKEMTNILRTFVLGSIFFSTICFAGSENTFSSVTAGFSVIKPDEWHFLTAEQNMENIERMQLDDEEFKQAMLKYPTAPLVAMVKYQEPFDDLNPSFKVNIKPIGNLKDVDPKTILNMMSGQLQNVLRDYKIVQEPIDTRVSGLKAATMTVNSTMVAPDGREFPITSDFWVVPRGEFFFMLGCGSRQDEKTGTRAELLEILETKKIEK